MDASTERAQHTNNIAPDVVGSCANWENLPDELKAQQQWVVWRLETRADNPKPTKVPYRPLLQRREKASSTAANTWGSFSEALEAFAGGGYNGIGFVFSDADPYCGVDLDGCINTETGEVREKDAAIIDQLDSYTELSPSGTGMHVIVKGSLAGLSGSKRGDYEMYSRGRFFTMTGDFFGENKPVGNRQTALEAVHSLIFEQKQERQASSPLNAPRNVEPDDQKLLEQMFASEKGGGIRALYDGASSAYAKDGNAGRSEGDLALANHLMWWTANDTARADRLFRQSGRMRPKWDEKRGATTYGQRTLENAWAENGGYSEQRITDHRPPPQAATDSGGRNPTPVSPPPRERQKLVLAADLHVQAQDVISALHAINDPPTIFQRGRELVRVVRADGEPHIEMLNHDSLRSFAQERLECVKQQPSKRKEASGTYAMEETPANLSRDAAAYILSASSWPFPELRGVVSTPHFSSKGDIVAQQGYSSKSNLFLDLNGFAPRPVNLNPSAAEVAEAKHLIFDELLRDFPFAEEASRTHAVALGLLPFVRTMIDGPTPLHASDAVSGPGTGKGLLVEALTKIATGRSALTMTEGRDDDEWRKRITASLLQSPSVLFIDNVRRKLDSGALASALTARVIFDRLLGQTKNVAVPNLACWVVSGNNITTSQEIARRTIWIRLNAKMEHAWERRPDEFAHPDLIAWAGDNRHSFVWAYMTLVQNWLASGRRPGRSRLGSYEAWSEIVGGILEAAGISGFLGNLQRNYERADAETAEWRTFVELWHDKFGSREVRAADLHTLAVTNDLLLGVMGDGNAHSQKSRFGRAIRNQEGRVFGRRTIRQGRGDAKAKVAGYFLEENDAGNGGASTGAAGLGGASTFKSPAASTPSQTQENEGAGLGGASTPPSNVKERQSASTYSRGAESEKSPAKPRQDVKTPSQTQENERGFENTKPRQAPQGGVEAPPRGGFSWPDKTEHPYMLGNDRTRFLIQAIHLMSMKGIRPNHERAHADALIEYLAACAGKNHRNIEDEPADVELTTRALALYGAAREIMATGRGSLQTWLEVAKNYVEERRNQAN